MTTEETTATSTDPNLPPVAINLQYIKDLSFEAPSTPGVFNDESDDAPDIKINVDVRAGQIGDKAFEVLLLINAQCNSGDKTAYITELAYGGVFTLNVADEHIKPMLLIECPRLLFPFARNIVADVTRDGGFPPLMLNPIDFIKMYKDGLEAGKPEGEAEAPAEAEAASE